MLKTCIPAYFICAALTGLNGCSDLEHTGFWTFAGSGGLEQSFADHSENGYSSYGQPSKNIVSHGNDQEHNRKPKKHYSNRSKSTSAYSGIKAPENFVAKESPDETRFLKAVLTTGLDEPTELAILNDGKVVIIERKGGIKLFDPLTRKTKLIGKLDVHTASEDGLMGIAVDPAFSDNNWVYIYYSPAGTKAVNVLSRFELKEGVLDIGSEKQILEIPVQRDQCCHTGGSIAFDAKGNLFLSTGDNTNPFESGGYAPIDGRVGRSAWDARRTSANSNDLRGKILRIHPEADGSYTIPKNNLFNKNGPLKGLPEIYVMGNRNPYRISVDQRTQFLYWGEVGPDAGKDSTRGPRGYDEINQAREAGNFGWPFFIGDNKAYRKYDFANAEPEGLFDPANPFNDSPNNTGSNILPPPQEAFIWYPYQGSEKFPLVGKGGRTAMAGPVYYADMYSDSKIKFPDYYDGKLFIYEWMRNWIMAVSLDEQGRYLSMERFLPTAKFSRPVDMQFGPDGAMYVLEYGQIWHSKNEEAMLVRIEYAEGNRMPNVLATVEESTGAAPFTAKFSGKQSFDYDENDTLTFAWYFTEEEVQSTSAEPTYTFTKPGVYDVVLKVTDSEMATVSSVLQISVGNARPTLEISTDENKTFYWDNHTIDYEVNISDKEDGFLGNGIEASKVLLTMDYLPQGYDMALIEKGHQATSGGGAFATGKALMSKSDCNACHATNKTVLGPSYMDIATKYKDKPGTEPMLVSRIIEGGSGNWGERAMAAHPQHSVEEVENMVRYILALDDEKASNRLPLRGSLKTTQHVGAGEEGSYIITASYTDRGGKIIGAITAKAALTLRHPRLQAENNDVLKKGVGTRRIYKPEGNYNYINKLREGAYIGFRNIDLTGIRELIFRVADKEGGGEIEVRTGSPTGTLLGTAIVKPTGGDEKWETVHAPLTTVSGFHDIYFVFTEGNSIISDSKALFHLDWIYFQNDQITNLK